MDVPRVDYEKLASDRAGESSVAVRMRVLAARERQQVRFDGSGLTCNADWGSEHIREYCGLDDTSKALMRSAMNQLGRRARTLHWMLNSATTITLAMVEALICGSVATSHRLSAAHN